MITEIINHLHPILVHFPIALLVVGVIYDLIWSLRHRSLPSLRGLWLWVVAAVGALLATLSGPDEDARGITPLLKIHENLAHLTDLFVILAVAIRLIAWLKRREKMVKWSLAGYLLIACLAGASVLATGYFGGNMVYNQGIGVQVNGQPVNPPKPAVHPED